MAISTNHKKYVCYYGQCKDALNQCQWKMVYNKHDAAWVSMMETEHDTTFGNS